MNYLKKGIVVCSLIGVVLSASSAYAKDVMLKEGMQGEDVKQIQISLKQLGYFNNETTGYFGSATKDAVKKFQSERKFSADGVVGPATWSSLVGDKKTQETKEEPKKTETNAPEAEKLETALKKGMQSEQIKKLQKRLKDLGAFDNEATGYFGQATETAVRNYQKNNGMNADGVVGKETWNKLFKVVEAKKEQVKISRGNTTRESTAPKGIIDYAKGFLNVKYVWGGNTPSGFDCSGFVKYVYQNYGIELNRVAADQAKQGTSVNKVNLKSGDLVFFDTDGGHNYINHVGIYISNDMFIHASSAQRKVMISNLSDGFYSKSFMTARRMFD